MNDTAGQTTKVREGFVAAEKIDETKARAQATEPQLEPSPAETPEPVDMWPITVKLLHKPIRNNKGDSVRELVFREPTGADINRYGNPVRINQEGDIVIDERKMSFMMAALAGILPPFLEGMDPRDWNSAAYRLRGFFLPEAAAW
jgi:Phage tail assembly chaperone proteins, E, or 41 or 14